jgi:hypothetical protein
LLSLPPAGGTLVGSAGRGVGALVFGDVNVGIIVAGIAVAGIAVAGTAVGGATSGVPVGVDGTVVGPVVPCDTSVDSAVGVTVNSAVAVGVVGAAVADAAVADAVVTGTTVSAADVAVASSARLVGEGPAAVDVALGVMPVAVGVVAAAVFVGALVAVLVGGGACAVLVGATVLVAAGAVLVGPAVLVGGAVVAVIAAIVGEATFPGPVIVSSDDPRALTAPAVTSTVLLIRVPLVAVVLARVRTSTEASLADDVTSEHESWLAVSVQVPPVRSVIVSA